MNTPCGTCCDNNYSCCRNARITWSFSEIDDLISAKPEILKRILLFKAEIPGFVYVIDNEAVERGQQEHLKNTSKIEYCAFYDHDNKCCSVYEHRPFVCSTYGQPEYNACPYGDMSEFDLLELIVKHPEVAQEMHSTAEMHPEKILQDYLEPYHKKFMEFRKENPEYFELWDSLPEVNFIKK